MFSTNHSKQVTQLYLHVNGIAEQEYLSQPEVIIKIPGTACSTLGGVLQMAYKITKCINDALFQPYLLELYASIPLLFLFPTLGCGPGFSHSQGTLSINKVECDKCDINYHS